MASEYLMMVGLAFLILIIFVSYFQDNFQGLMTSREQRLMKDLAYMVQQEVLIASSVEQGYHRAFVLPDTLDGFPYTIENSPKKVIIKGERFDFAITMPQVKGTIKKGTNIIRRDNGLICLGEVNCTDYTIPSVVASGPSGSVPSPVTISADTDEESTCKYSDDDLDYYSMRDAMSGTTISHDAVLSLASGPYTYFVRCTDQAGNAMNTSETIVFTVVP